MGCLAAVIEEIHPANRADDPTSPSVRLPTDQWRRTFSSQLFHQLTTENRVFFVEVFPAKVIDHLGNQVADGLHILGQLSTGGLLFHRCFPQLYPF